MKLHQMLTDVAEVELAEARLQAHFRLIEPEVAEVQCLVDAVPRFVVAVAPIAVLIGPFVDELVAPVADVSAVDALMAVKQMNVPVLVLVLMTVEVVVCWPDDIPLNFGVEKSLLSNRILRFLLCCCLVRWRTNVDHLRPVFLSDSTQSLLPLSNQIVSSRV